MGLLDDLVLSGSRERDEGSWRCGMRGGTSGIGSGAGLAVLDDATALLGVDSSALLEVHTFCLMCPDRGCGKGPSRMLIVRRCLLIRDSSSLVSVPVELSTSLCVFPFAIGAATWA